MGTIDEKRLLVVDDERAIADLVRDVFAAEGIEADAFYSGAHALEALEQRNYALVIADVMMPGMDGFELCAEIRKRHELPIVFLTAKDTESDIVVGLTIGADDYIVKPFKPKELVARVKAHLRRAERSKRQGIASTNQPLFAKGIELDVKGHAASLHDIPLQLTPKEFGILSELMQHLGEPVPSKVLYERVWEEAADACSANTIMVHIRHLRKKLAEIDSSTEIIETAWGGGYKIDA